MRHAPQFLAALAVLILGMLSFAAPAAAQALPRAAPTQRIAVQALPPAVTKANFSVEKATDAYLARVSAKDRAKAAAFAAGNHWLTLADTLYMLALAALLLFTKASTRMRELTARLTRSRFLQAAIYGGEFVVVLTVLSFPLSFYEDFLRRHAYRISNLSLPQWLGEFAISFGLQLGFGIVIIALIYWAIRMAPRTWWAWGTAIAVAFLAFGMLIFPVFISPLFNTAVPLKASPLRSRIEALAEANGVPSDNIFVVNTSKQSDLINANVSGLFGTTRISLDDTLLKRCTDREILAVVAHEMGHYVLGHNYVMLTWIGLIVLGGFAFTAWGFDRLAQRFASQWGIGGITDPAGLPLIFALFNLYMLLTMPAVNTLSRHIEAQADIFGLNAARQPDAFAQVMLTDPGVSDLDPGRIEEILFWNHPSGRSRIHMAMQWKAEHLRDADIAAGPVSPQ